MQQLIDGTSTYCQGREREIHANTTMFDVYETLIYICIPFCNKGDHHEEIESSIIIGLHIYSKLPEDL